MTKLLKTAAIAALITGFANTAQAGSPYAFQTDAELAMVGPCLLYTSPSPRDATLSRMPSSA